MDKRRIWLAERLGNMFRVSQNSVDNLTHEAMCSVLTAAADVASDTGEDRDEFLRIADESEIAGV